MRKRDILSLTAVIVGILWVFGSLASSSVYTATTVNGLNANTPAQRSNPSEFSNAIREIKDVLRRVLPNDIVANATNATTAAQATNSTTLGGYSGSAPNTNTPNTYAIWNNSGYLNVPFRGALVYNSGSQVAAQSGILFDSEEYDTDGFHSTVTNSHMFTIPDGVTAVEVSFFANTGGGSGLTASGARPAIVKNNSRSYAGVPFWEDTDAGKTHMRFMRSPTLFVSPGDTFFVNGITSTSLTGGYSTWFAIKVVQ